MKIQIFLPEQKKLRVISGKHDYFYQVTNLIGYDKAKGLELDHEPTNVADKNAICVKCQGIPIGYLVREDAAEFINMLYVIKKLEQEDRIKTSVNFIDFFALHKMTTSKEDKRQYRELLLQIKKK
jgi:hypothetical protein